MDKEDVFSIVMIICVSVMFVSSTYLFVFNRNNFDVENAVKENNKLQLEFYKETGNTHYKDYSEWLENKLNKGK